MTTAAFVLALVSLIIASSSLTWQVVMFLLSGSRVKVRGTYSYVPTMVGEMEKYVTLIATNVGRQPVTITSFAMLAPGGNQLIEPRSALVPLELPVHMPPGDERSFHYEVVRVNRTLAEQGLRMTDLLPAVNVAGGKRVTGRRFR